ncbi:hypothetical protein ACFSLT_15820 [Novosphingobium resinovorum]
MTAPSIIIRKDRPMLAIALRLAAMVMLSTMFMLVKLAGEAGSRCPNWCSGDRRWRCRSSSAGWRRPAISASCAPAA